MTSIHLTTQTSNNLHYSVLQRLGYIHLGIQGNDNSAAIIMSNIKLSILLDNLVTINLSLIHQVFSELSSQYFQELFYTF